MASTDAPYDAASIAVDREEQGASGPLGPEQDIENDSLSNLLSAS